MSINYDDWINMPTWEAWEAAMLFSGFIADDENLFYALMKPLEDLRYDNQVGRLLREVPKLIENFKKNAKAIERAIQFGDLSEGAKFLENSFVARGEPHQFVKIAKKYKLTIPTELNDIKVNEDKVGVLEKVVVDKKLKSNQVDKEICCALAQLLWNENLPLSQKEKDEMEIDYEVLSTRDLKISKMCKHPWLKKYGNAAQYEESTIQNWIKDFAPSNNPGRPKKP